MDERQNEQEQADATATKPTFRGFDVTITAVVKIDPDWTPPTDTRLARPPVRVTGSVH